MAKNRYYLFARDKDTNKVKPISISDYDIYGFGTDIRKVNNSLEAIDSMTINFDNQEELVYYLVSTGRLDNYNTDLFIVSRNQDNIVFLENIYSKYKFSNDLKRVSEDKLKGLCSFSGDNILDRFAFMMINDQRFRRFIESKFHRVYSKYIEYLNGCYDISSANKIKYNDLSWARKSYPLLRNIVEAISRYDKLKEKSGSISNLALNHEVELNSLRNISKDEISIYTDKGYEEGQLNLFINDKEENDRVNVVTDFLCQLDSDSFYLDERQVHFNKDKFDCSRMEYKQLDNLDKRLMRLLYLFTVTKRFNEFDGYTELSNNNVTLETLKNINKLLLEDENMLNMAYAFCLLYSRLSDKKIDSKIYKKVRGEQ